MKKILFRADANPPIGTGDLVSFINLAGYFRREGWQTHFIIRNYASAVKLVEKYCPGKVLMLKDAIPLTEEIKVINRYISKSRIDVFFIQVTEHKLAEYAEVNGAALKACVSFNKDIPANIDLVLNWDVGAETFFDTSRYPQKTFLLGPEYAILPANFNLKKAKARAYRKAPRTLLIAMGGADELNFTQKMVNSLIRNGTGLKLKIIVGSGYAHRSELARSLIESGIKHEIKQNITDMFAEYMSCDVAVGAGGLTVFELIASGTPALIVATYEHQVKRCEYFGESGLIKYLGFRDFDERLLMEGINNPSAPLRGTVFDTRKIVTQINRMVQGSKN